MCRHLSEFSRCFSGIEAGARLASVLQDQDNRLAKVRQAFFTRFPLAVGSGHFGAICDVPWAVLLDNRHELIVHASILPPPALIRVGSRVRSALGRKRATRRFDAMECWSRSPNTLANF